MKIRFATVVLFVVAVLLFPKCDIEACGPDWVADVFVNITTPDDHEAFASGHLGILQAGFDSSDYAVAYRYLIGGKLEGYEHKAYTPPSAAPTHDESWWAKASPEQRQQAEKEIATAEEARKAALPINMWVAERAKYVSTSNQASQKPSFETDWRGHLVIDEDYLNCPDAAFQNATATLVKRSQTWGKDSKLLAEWIGAQDAVFSNCAAKNGYLPSDAPPDSPALLKADRAYQIASATFYSRQFDKAAQQFAAIAADHNSPWSDWGKYLEARATVRKAFENGKATDPYSGDLASFDLDAMRRAQQMLELLLAQPNPKPSRTVVENELNFIRIRTEPQIRAAEICAALAGSAPDANFEQDLADLNFLLVKHIDVKGPAPLLDWIKAWRGAGTAATAYSTWQQTHALPWLIIAIFKTGPSDQFAASLVEEAKKITPQSPAYDTVFYHRARLLIAMKRTDEARALLDAAIPALRKQKPSSTLNALLGERMKVARNFSEFLDYAARNTISADSQGVWDLHGQCNERAHAANRGADCPDAESPVEFDEDAATVLNRKTPLKMLIDAARSETLPQNLREALATIAWTRSVLLEDAPSTAAASQLLPKPIRETAGADAGFRADLAILRNPGIRPYIEAGVPRVSSYSYLDNFRNNWWCKPGNEQQGYGEHTQDSVPTPSFIPADQITLADTQFAALQKLPDSAIVIGQRVLTYAKVHPDDPQVPEALALTVRATHYACQSYSGSEYTPTSKAAFELLHKSYPKSLWTAKTRYYY